MGGMSPQDGAQGRNSPREATPGPEEAWHEETMRERAAQAMNHGEVCVQQPISIEENPQLARPSALLLRRQRVLARNGRVPISNLTMNTEDTRRVGREEDALDAPHYAQAWQEVKQRRLRKEAAKQQKRQAKQLCEPSEEHIYERWLARTEMWTTMASPEEDDKPEVDGTYEDWLARTQSWMTTACAEDGRPEDHEQNEDVEFFDTLERQSNASAE